VVFVDRVLRMSGSKRKEENCMMKNFIFLTKCYLDEQSNQNKLGGACNVHEQNKKCIKIMVTKSKV
jgi:hypothetical protein